MFFAHVSREFTAAKHAEMIEAASSGAPLPLTLASTRTFEIPNRRSKLAFSGNEVRVQQEPETPNYLKISSGLKIPPIIPPIRYIMTNRILMNSGLGESLASQPPRQQFSGAPFTTL